ncbi:MAG: glycosyltransferase, partial [Candidatus Bathyarchaeota archaeon]
MSTMMFLGEIFSYVALAIGLVFFLFACKYYISILIALFTGKGTEEASLNRKNTPTTAVKHSKKNLFNGRKELNLNIREPFVSIQLPFYNERNVARRIIQACINIDYTNYEILVADDSKDETISILKELSRRSDGPTVKVIHRKDRSGYKGGALQKAAEYMDPRTEYVVVLDADFIPPPDILRRFLWYFEGPTRGGFIENGDDHRFGGDIVNHYVKSNGEDENDLLDKVDKWYERNRIGVVQGYQLHHLNKNENWITKGIRAEFSGGYMIERVSEEFFGAMKMITGSVFMIRAEIVKKLGWTHSITEDWDLTLRMYMDGYKVLYTPLVQAPAEIPKTIRAVARQRMRWAEGHTFAVKKYFTKMLRSPKVSRREKLEFLYFSPYYLQSFFFLVGSIFWLIAELIGSHPFFWSAVFGWSLILSNLLALPMMSLTGLYLERSAQEDFSGIFSMIILSYVIAPFQAYAAIKGLLEQDEGGWVRTLKTGSITDRILQIKLRRLFRWIVPEREIPLSRKRGSEKSRSSKSALVLILLMSSFIIWVTASASSIPNKGQTTTALYFEYSHKPIEFNGKTTNRILTHPNFASLGDTAYVDSCIPTDEWERSWSFYLLDPIIEPYKIKGRLNTKLYLYGTEEGEIDLKIKFLQLDENLRTKNVINHECLGVELEGEVPDKALDFYIATKKADKFEEGGSILIEIWLRGGENSPSTVKLTYDSIGKNSRIEFPRVIMPESLLALIFIVLLLPAFVKS